jgi:hypothetical protein
MGESAATFGGHSFFGSDTTDDLLIRNDGKRRSKKESRAEKRAIKSRERAERDLVRRSRGRERKITRIRYQRKKTRRERLGLRELDQ